MPQVKVTVLMTLYNKAPFVAEAARSVLEGSFTDLELLVVDDASTDGGPEVVLALNDPRVRLVRNERNSGRAASANRGYDEARGEYVAVLDADDVQHPDRLLLQVAFMDAHPEVGICGTGARYFGARSGESFWPATQCGVARTARPLRSVIGVEPSPQWGRDLGDAVPLFIAGACNHCEMGRLMSKVVPRPTSDSTVIVPPCSATRLCTIARPSPVPFPAALVVNNCLKISPRILGSIPCPSSSTHR